MRAIFTTKDGSVCLGISAEGGWVAEVRGARIDLERREAFRALLPVLEEEPRDVTELLNAAIQEHDLAAFPVEELILHALEFASSYWKELALAWLESAPRWSPALAERLEAIGAKGSKWPQPMRHKVQKLLRAHAGRAASRK
ncbi:MAG: hypothetical protein JKY37_27035 [Nannocystaceae bacterium]|nr:hypothetical protein [Nannocystaceae bacterium]